MWGQVDSVGVVFMLLGVRELWKGRHERAAILTVVAALIKPQLGILIPIVAWVTVRRALWPQGAYGDDPEPEPSGFAWERRPTTPVRILTTGLAGLLTAVILSAPFGLSVVGLTEQIGKTAAGYPYLTVNAYNPWALVTTDVNGQAWGLAQNGGWVCDVQGPPTPEGADPIACSPQDNAAHATILGVPPVIVGTVLLVLAVLGVSALVARRPDRLTILVGLAVLALAFFVVPTRVHERYLFPLVAIGAILAVVSWRWAIAYVVSCVATFGNMYVVLTTIYPGHHISDWLGIGPDLRTTFWVSLMALAQLAVFAWAAVQLRDRARRRLADDLVDAGDLDADEDVGEWQPEAGRPLAPWAAGAGVAGSGAGVAGAGGAGAGAAGMAFAVASTGTRPLPAWEVHRVDDDRPWWVRFRDRVRETPTRPDRSASLDREPGGRLDRLDLWLLAVLVVASLLLRSFRLEEPVQMHFDEVYHARTATEFLQLWRYGISKEIYEWTHPHLAKYAMAAGIVAFAGHDVAETSELDVPVRDSTVERRYPDQFLPGGWGGDKLWIATGDEVIGYDLDTRKVVSRSDVPGASAVAVDPESHLLVIGTDSGELLTLDLAGLDAVRGGDPAEQPGPEELATLDGGVRELAAFEDGGTVLAVLDDDRIVNVDDATGAIVGRGSVPGANSAVPAGRGDAVVVDRAALTDPATTLATLAGLVGADVDTLQARLDEGGDSRTVLVGNLDEETKKAVQEAIDDNTLEGLAIEQVGRMAVTGEDGVTFVTPGGDAAATIPVDHATGAALITGIENGSQLYVTAENADGQPILARIDVTGDAAKDGPHLRTDPIRMPGAVDRIVYDPATELIHVLGVTPDGRTSTVYVVEPHANVVFADHKLPFAPSAWALDTSPDYPSSDRNAVLAFSPDGTAASLDMGHYAFAWRLPGVIAGVVTVALLYLLGRILFRRRAVAIAVGFLALFDGMEFVQSRIGMNDVYVGVFIIAAYLLFAALWTGAIRHRHAFWALLPVIGVLLGLALASKWVAAYAIGALGILYLGRSALGRVILILGLVGATTLLGWMAISVPEGQGAGNLTFMFLMIGLTLAGAAICVLRPIAWSMDEVRFAIAAPGAVGIILALAAIATGRAMTGYTVGPLTFTPLHVAFAAIVASFAVAGTFSLAGRLGFGPLAPPPDADDPIRLTEPAAPAAEGWLRIGWGLGLPAGFVLACLVALPVLVYVISYIPWGFVDNKAIVDGFPVASHTGPATETLIELTQRMYNYHNTLSEPHAASSPWWAWPLDLKPVWFYQGGFANGTAASIYDAGNIVIWWLGIPAMVAAAWWGFKRRSLGLALIVVGFLCQWVSWARIDRAAFQYHYYTSLPFILMALGYFIAELWNGASRRTWLVARIAAAVTLLGPVILWIAKAPLCGFVGVERVNPGSQACVGNPGNLEVTPAAAGIVVVGLGMGVLLVWLLLRLSRPRPDGRPTELRDLFPLIAVAGIGGALLFVVRQLPGDTALISMPGLVPEAAAVMVGIPMLLVALPIVTARDSRRFVIGLMAAIAGWFVVLYPNISALPLPSTIVNAYQGLLPTYLYPFQFPVSTVDRSGTISLADPRLPILGLSVLIAVLVVAYAAWVWRIALAERAAEERRREPPTGFVGGEA